MNNCVSLLCGVSWCLYVETVLSEDQQVVYHECAVCCPLTSCEEFYMLPPPPESVQNRAATKVKISDSKQAKAHKHKVTGNTYVQTAQTHKLKDWESVKAACNHILINLFILSGHVSPLSQSLTQRSHCDMSNLFWPENRKERKPSTWPWKQTHIHRPLATTVSTLRLLTLDWWVQGQFYFSNQPPGL